MVYLRINRLIVIFQDSLTTQFNAFLSRGASVPMLDFNSVDGTALAHTSAPSPSTKNLPQQRSLIPERAKSKAQIKRKVILVEDLPNVFTSDATRTAFRQAITRFVQLNKGYAAGVPMVLIISETIIKGTSDEWLGSGVGSSSSWNDNLSVRNLVPLDVLKGGKALEIKCVCDLNSLIACLSRQIQPYRHHVHEESLGSYPRSCWSTNKQGQSAKTIARSY